MKAAALHAQTLSTSDTSIEISASQRGVIIQSLKVVDPEKAQQIISVPLTLPVIAWAKQGGQRKTLHWRFVAKSFDPKKGELEAVFASDEPAMELRSRWVAAVGESGPIEHFLTIANRGKEAVELPWGPTLMLGAKGKNLEQWWVEKGGGSPSPIGRHIEAIEPGFSSNLLSTSYSNDNPHDAIPWMAVQSRDGSGGWYAGIESSARVVIHTDAHIPSPGTPGEGQGGGPSTSSGQVSRSALDRSNAPPPQPSPGVPGAGEKGGAPEIEFTAMLGLQPVEGVLTRLAPGETFEAPPVFLGCYEGDVDDGCNRLRHWVSRHLRPPTDDPRYPLLVNNSWGGGMKIDETISRKMIDESSALGFEMFHIDAGWFRGVGDWVPGPTKFPNGLAPIADYAHSKGMKFGLWVGWTQGGIITDTSGRQATLSVFDPAQRDWFPISYPANFKPSDFTGATVCLGDPRAADWCLEHLRNIVRENKLDMLEHDQVMIVDKCGRADHLHTDSPVDISYRGAQGYYRVQDSLRREFPELLFEDCVNGGRQVDYGIVRRVHYISITDTYDPLSNRRAFFDASYALPPAMCECYVENRPGKTPANFLYMLRSGMMGWFTLMTDTMRWTPGQHELSRKELELYKTSLRPLIRDGNVFHVSDRPDGVRWDGMELTSANRLSGALFAFRGTGHEGSHTFLFKGLNSGAIYAVSSPDRPGWQIFRTGRALEKVGLKIELSEPESSQVILFKADAPD